MTLLATWGKRGGGAGEFSGPAGIAVGSSTSVYVVDTENHRVQRFGGCGELLGAWGSQGFAIGEFWSPSAIAVGGTGDVYVADTRNHRIQRFSATGEFLGV
jgi:DNA-binding beta-propeller fold protein YncE